MPPSKRPAPITGLSEPLQAVLSRRERQIMDVIYRLGEAGAAEVAKQLPDRPATNTVRVTMAILERKGFLMHREDGPRHVHAPTVPLERAQRSALRHLLKTFFASSPANAILALLDMSSTHLSKEQLDEVAGFVERARQEPRHE